MYCVVVHASPAVANGTRLLIPAQCCNIFSIFFFFYEISIFFLSFGVIFAIVSFSTLLMILNDTWNRTFRVSHFIVYYLNLFSLRRASYLYLFDAKVWTERVFEWPFCQINHIRNGWKVTISWSSYFYTHKRIIQRYP